MIWQWFNSKQVERTILVYKARRKNIGLLKGRRGGILKHESNHWSKFQDLNAEREMYSV